MDFLERHAKSKIKNTSPTSIEIDNVQVTNNPELSSNFNSHFSTVGEEIQSSINPVTDPMTYLKNRRHNKEFKFREITVDEVEKVIMSMNNKGTDCQTIPNKIYKLASHIISRPL